MHRFAYNGCAVILTLEQLRDGGIWIAAVEGRDLLHMIPQLEASDEEAAVRQVCTWIDEGMPLGERFSYRAVEPMGPMRVGGGMIPGEPGEYPRFSE